MNQYEPVIPAAEKMCDKVAAQDQSGNTRHALRLCANILKRFPGYPRALHAKGVLLFKLDRLDEAISAMRECLANNPSYVDAMNSLGNIYRSCYRYEDALACYGQILQVDKTNFRAMFSMGQIKHKEQDERAALACFRNALKYNRSFVPAYLGIINIYKKRNRLVEAEKFCRKVLKLEPENVEALYLLAALRADHGDIQHAINLMEKVKCSDTYGLGAHASILYYLNLLPEIRQEQIYQESKLFEERFVQRLQVFQTPHINCPDPERKIRIGFVSGDIKLHPVARHLRPLVQHMDRSRFELYAYNNFNVHDEVTEEFKSLFCYWRNIHELSDEKVTEMVRLDTIDILFDLSGYTGHSRLLLFARKPAPIQISWLGYFNTTGFQAMDYLISDDITVHAEEEEKWFSEEILRLPHSRFCYDPREDILPDVASQPASKVGFVTFGAFCKVNKLNDQVVKTWSRILAAVPNSRLILKWWAYKDKSAIKSVSDKFVRFGTDPARLEFRDESGYVELLREYTCDIDISLDTFPHSGGATSCDALLMGVPVITLSGQIPISRQTHGFLHVMGLDNELVAYSEDDYVARAVNLAQNLPCLKELRSSLRDRLLKSPLCDGETFTRNFEELMRFVWRRWCDGKLAEVMLRSGTHNPAEIYNEGINLMGEHDFKHAAQYFASVVESEPKNDKAINNLAICLWESEDIDNAEQMLLRGRRVNRANDDIYCNLAGIMLHKSRYREALAYSRDGLKINDSNVELYINQVLALQGLTRLYEALCVLNHAIATFQPTSAMYATLGNCHASMGNVAQAEQCLRKALELDGSNLFAHSNLLYVMNYASWCSQQQMYEEALQWNRHHVVAPPHDIALPLVTKNDNKLRIGLVSADFRMHPGGMLLKPFMEHFDRNKLEVYCYYNHHKHDAMTAFLQSCSSKWQNVKLLSDLELYELIKKDNIDILIDMNGHTDKHRLRMFTMKPCAIQATWLGYFNTTGIQAIDYFISDVFTTPEWMQNNFSEKILRMPHSRFCYAAPDYSPLVSLAPSEWKGYITFGAFNNCAKLSNTTLEMWAQILRAVPKSRLLLKWKSYRDNSVKEWIYEKFNQLGIKRHRIVLRRDIDHAQMLADYSDVDIVLDTYPFNGGMTSIEALWMGVPIVTLVGETPASRQTGSFLRLVGLEECIAEDQDAYVNAAIALALNPTRLYDIRGTLRQKMKKSPLMDGALFAQNMQQLLEQMMKERG